MPVTINGSNTPTAGSVTYGDGTQYANTAAGTAGQVLTSNGAAAPTWAAAAVTSPAGSNTQIQFNNAGAFGASSTFIWESGNTIRSNQANGTNAYFRATSGAVDSYYGSATSGLGTVGVAGTFSAHDLVLYSNSSERIRLATTGAVGFAGTNYGTSGQVLTSGGSGAAPTWSTPSAGAMTLISTQTASTSATLQWTGLSGYSRYFLVMTNLIPTTNNTEMRISVGTGATPTYGSFYSWVYAQIINSGLNSNSSASSNNVTITNSNKNTATYADTTGLSGEIVIVNANGGYTTISGRFIGNPNSSTGTDIMTGTFGGSAQDNTARTAVRLLFSSGNILSGSATLYGLS